MNKEIVRKALHVCLIVIPIMVWQMPYGLLLPLLGGASLLVVGADMLRRDVPLLDRTITRLFGSVMRAHEHRKALTGASWMFLGTFISVLCFSKPVATLALLVLIVSDSMAAIIGRCYGAHGFSLFPGKTYEGSLAFFTSACLLSLGAYGVMGDSRFLLASLVGSAVSTLAELGSSRYRVDDNIVIPLSFSAATAFVLYLFSYFSF